MLCNCLLLLPRPDSLSTAQVPDVQGRLPARHGRGGGGGRGDLHRRLAGPGRGGPHRLPEGRRGGRRVGRDRGRAAKFGLTLS